VFAIIRLTNVPVFFCVVPLCWLTETQTAGVLMIVTKSQLIRQNSN
jgi:hypothetical protein